MANKTSQQPAYSMDPLGHLPSVEGAPDWNATITGRQDGTVENRQPITIEGEVVQSSAAPAQAPIVISADKAPTNEAVNEPAGPAEAVATDVEPAAAAGEKDAEETTAAETQETTSPQKTGNAQMTDETKQAQITTALKNLFPAETAPKIAEMLEKGDETLFMHVKNMVGTAPAGDAIEFDMQDNSTLSFNTKTRQIEAVAFMPEDATFEALEAAQFFIDNSDWKRFTPFFAQAPAEEAAQEPAAPAQAPAVEEVQETANTQEPAEEQTPAEEPAEEEAAAKATEPAVPEAKEPAVPEEDVTAAANGKPEQSKANEFAGLLLPIFTSTRKDSKSQAATQLNSLATNGTPDFANGRVDDMNAFLQDISELRISQVSLGAQVHMKDGSVLMLTPNQTPKVRVMKSRDNGDTYQAQTHAEFLVGASGWMKKNGNPEQYVQYVGVVEDNTDQLLVPNAPVASADNKAAETTTAPTDKAEDKTQKDEPFAFQRTETTDKVLLALKDVFSTYDKDSKFVDALDRLYRGDYAADVTPEMKAAAEYVNGIAATRMSKPDADGVSTTMFLFKDGSSVDFPSKEDLKDYGIAYYASPRDANARMSGVQTDKLLRAVAPSMIERLWDGNDKDLQASEEDQQDLNEGKPSRLKRVFNSNAVKKIRGSNTLKKIRDFKGMKNILTLKNLRTYGLGAGVSYGLGIGMQFAITSLIASPSGWLVGGSAVAVAALAGGINRVLQNKDANVSGVRAFFKGAAEGAGYGAASILGGVAITAYGASAIQAILGRTVIAAIVGAHRRMYQANKAANVSTLRSLVKFNKAALIGAGLAGAGGLTIAGFKLAAQLVSGVADVPMFDLHSPATVSADTSAPIVNADTSASTGNTTGGFATPTYETAPAATPAAPVEPPTATPNGAAITAIGDRLFGPNSPTNGSVVSGAGTHVDSPASHAAAPAAPAATSAHVAPVQTAPAHAAPTQTTAAAPAVPHAATAPAATDTSATTGHATTVSASAADYALPQDQMDLLPENIRKMAGNTSPEGIIKYCKEASFFLINKSGSHSVETLQAANALIERGISAAEGANIGGKTLNTLHQLHADMAYTKAWGIGTTKDLAGAVDHIKQADGAPYAKAFRSFFAPIAKKQGLSLD